MKTVSVGSENPVKIEAVRAAFAAMWPNEDWSVNGVAVESGVADQPMSDEESIAGARKRARDVLAAMDADFGVGLEGGMQETGGQWIVRGWAVVRSVQGGEGIGSSVGIVVPDEMMRLIHQGRELNEVYEALFDRKNVGAAEGHFGFMTDNRITRTHAYRDAVIAALAPFLRSVDNTE